MPNTSTPRTNDANSTVPMMNVAAAIVAAHAAAEHERRELRMLERCGELLTIDAQLLAAAATARAERQAARLSAVKQTGRATTIDLAIWGDDCDGLYAAVRRDLAAASLL
jgi:hypothetical protein